MLCQQGWREIHLRAEKADSLEGNDRKKRNGWGKNRSRFPAGMTTRKATARARTKADSLREWQKEKQSQEKGHGSFASLKMTTPQREMFDWKGGGSSFFAFVRND